jgi:hypothetical protein
MMRFSATIRMVATSGTTHKTVAVPSNHDTARVTLFEATQTRPTEPTERSAGPDTDGRFHVCDGRRAAAVLSSGCGLLTGPDEGQ